MNTGAEYMREHIPDDAGLQYAITNGGKAPNPVPPDATVWYTVRGATRPKVESVTEWLREVAEAAAQMTQTKLSEVRMLTASYDYLPNGVITEALWENMEAIGTIEYTDEDREFAAKLKAQFDEATIDSQLIGMPEPLKKEVKRYALYPDPIKAYTEQERVNTSTDVADVSWITPTGQFWAATWPVGAPGHTWPVVAANGSFGKKGAVYAAKVLAATAYDLFADGETLRRAKAEHEEARGGRRYESPLPPDATPPAKLVRLDED
jgi:aminobenzoyl-glutamate utilization protein B